MRRLDCRKPERHSGRSARSRREIGAVARKARAGKAKVVVPLKAPGHVRSALFALVPRARTIVLLFALLAAAIGLYALALESSIFAVRSVAIRGAPPALARQVRAAVNQFEGRSLVGLSSAAVERAVLSIPSVRGVRVNRDFPNTLQIDVQRELPVAVLRRGPEAWLIAASGKVVRSARLGGESNLPRIWVASSEVVNQGETVSDRDVRTAVTALGSLRGHGSSLHIIVATARAGELRLSSASGVELRLGNTSQVPLKLAVAAEIVPSLPAPPAGYRSYLDVSVPGRPVSGTTLKSEVQPHG